ncbi:unnamed protein product [Withania somnifera]
MNSKVFFLLSILVAFSQLTLVCCRKSKSSHALNGFSLDLIHRDSPLSPYYNPSMSPCQLLRDACHRSFPRASFLMKAFVHSTTPFNHYIQSDIISIPGEYLMKLSIGTPPRETFAIADTGSDLTWIQCKPCTKCFNQSFPIFDPRKSSTYKTVSCHTNACEIVGSATCVTKNVCAYEINYGDDSYSTGDVAFETFIFASTTSKTKKVENISIPNVIFGCGYNNDGTFNNHTSGVVGLGFSKISIIQQLDRQIKGRFSYCLIPVDLSPFSSPPNATSKINFGPKAVVSGPNVLTTPIIQKNTDPFYYLNLESVSVGEKRLEFKTSQLSSSVAGEEDIGNIIIDSGTTLTFLPEEFYNKLESTLVEMINGTRKEDPYHEFGLCYGSKKDVTDAPKIVFHFTDADIELLPMSTFAEVDQDLTCLTIVSAGFIGAIYGNLAQMNFLIGYDLLNHKLSFLPTDCTKH